MAADVENAQGIVDKARVTLSAFMRDKDYEWLRENILSFLLLHESA